MASTSTEADVRQRPPRQPVVKTSGSDLDEENLAERVKQLPQSADTLGPLDGLLAMIPEKWRNYTVRFVFTWIMIGGFVAIVRMGPLALMVLVLAIQFKCFSEIINIGHAIYRVYDLPWFRTLSWYLLLTSNYFFYGESLIDYWAILLRKDKFLQFVVTHHRFISFTLYIIGFVWFVTALKKGYYMRQFSLFAWTHVTLLLIVSQSYLIIQNIFQGLVWFLLPVSMIIVCDIMSYMFGFFFGKTPLIKLSPKKTWEGFLGGAASTVVFGLMYAYYMLDKEFYVCPLEYSENAESFTSDCVIPSTFQLSEYVVPRPISYLFMLARRQPRIVTYPFLLHTIVIGLFASLIGPFGGFFASGFKRAFKIKDFGDVIPGHGGLMDRFDCQLLLGTFVNVYISTFIRAPSIHKLVQNVLMLPAEQQAEFYTIITEHLRDSGALALLNNTA